MTIITKNEYGTVSLVSVSEQVNTVVITHQHCNAKVSLYGGQVLSWQPTEHEEVFWLSKNSAYACGKAIRGGIPLCWPWFGGYQHAGNHGFLRTQTWTLSDVEVTPEGVELSLSWQGGNMHPLWPSEAKLGQKIFFGEVFKQTLLMENLSTLDVQYTGALHSYFAVSDPKSVTIDDLNGELFDCKLSGHKQLKDCKLNMQGPMDRIYYSANEMEIIDKGLKRVLTVSSTNCQQWVLWNPGTLTANSMKDMHPHSENEFVCLEAANTQWQTIPAQSVAILGQHISISRT